MAVFQVKVDRHMTPQDVNNVFSGSSALFGGLTLLVTWMIYKRAVAIEEHIYKPRFRIEKAQLTFDNRESTTTCWLGLKNTNNTTTDIKSVNVSLPGITDNLSFPGFSGLHLQPEESRKLTANIDGIHEIPKNMTITIVCANPVNPTKDITIVHKTPVSN